MRTRVLLVSSVHPPTDPRIFYKIAPALAKQYEVTCVVPGARRQMHEQFAISALPFYRKLLTRIILCHPLILWHFLKTRPHIVHIFVPELLPLAFLFRILGSTIVYEVQENLYKKFNIKTFNNAWIYRKSFRIFDQAARRYFNVIVTEDSYLQEYRQLAKPFCVVHNYPSIPFIDTYRADSGTSGVPEFFYAGVISLERCFDVIILALAKLKRLVPEFRMHFVGPMRITPEVVASLPGYAEIAGNLRFDGYTDQKLFLSSAGRALCGVALLRPVADYTDSYTTKLFEYMALGIPVITSDFRLYQDVVERSECGFCIPPDNADELCKKFFWLISHPEDAANMGQNGRDCVIESYNWESEEAHLLRFYQKLA